MALKKSDLYSSLWQSSDELVSNMDTYLRKMEAHA